MITNVTATIQPGKHVVLQRNDAGELYVQTFDAYGYQLEFGIEQTRMAGVMRVYAYKHPFRPAAERNVTNGVAKRLLERIWRLSQEYPTLLWNDTDERRAQHDGFVRFHNALLHGAEPSITLLP